MIKEKKWNLYFAGTCIILASLFFAFTNFFCSGVRCYNLEISALEPIYLILAGLIPTSLILLFFPEKIFIFWTKHIAWWFSIFVIYLFILTDPDSNGFLTPTRLDATIFWATILVVITLIYALIMNKKLKNS